MFGLGVQELIIILAIVVLLFGASRLPQVGEGVGKMITNFRKGMKSGKELEDKKDGDDKSSSEETPS